MPYPFASPNLLAAQEAKAAARDAARAKWREVESLRAEIAADAGAASPVLLEKALRARHEYDLLEDAVKAADRNVFAVIGDDTAQVKGPGRFAPLIRDAVAKRQPFEAKAAGTYVLEGAPVAPADALYVYETLGRPGAFGSVVPFTRIGAQTNSASVTAPGDTKLTSSVGATTTNASVVTIAHIERAQNQSLQDVPGYADDIATFLLHGLAAKVDSWVLAGIAADASVLTASVTGDPFVEVSYAAAVLAAAYARPNLVVLSPARWHTFSTTRAGGSTTTDGPFLANTPGSPIDAPARRLWGMQVVVSPEMGDDHAVVMDTSAISVPTVQDLTVEWSTNADDFATNQQTARAECRVGLAIARPGWVYRMPLS